MREVKDGGKWVKEEASTVFWSLKYCSSDIGLGGDE
jgi:hypothetical protein